ncbi:MAG TPA: hypothetical protein VKV32_14580, partial [Stellaceae bacterium]|nr:hypothetical protein [Stellaceae bacterium]
TSLDYSQKSDLPDINFILPRAAGLVMSVSHDKGGSPKRGAQDFAWPVDYYRAGEFGINGTRCSRSRFSYGRADARR